MIDEKKLINYIKAQINPYGKPFNGTTYEFCLKIMNYIERMWKYDCAECEAIMNLKAALHDAKKKTEWIPCSERVPEESGTYIVNAIENHIVHVTFAKWMPRMKKWDLTGSRSYWKVTAWMPLPEPYKGE